MRIIGREWWGLVDTTQFGNLLLGLPVRQPHTPRYYSTSVKGKSSMTFKLTFRFERADYSESARADIDREVKVMVQKKLDEKSIKASRIFPPGRNSVKVMFSSENELNEVLDNEGHFTAADLYPK